MNEIPETIEKVINVLAEKFGQTGKQLWNAIILQKRLRAWQGIGGGIVILISDAFAASWFLSQNNSGGCDPTQNFCAWGTVGVIVFCLPIVVWGFSELTDGIIKLLNPTYAALDDITSMLH